MKIAIAGYGMEGEASYNYWSTDPNNQITILDQKQPSRQIPDDVKTVIGNDYLDNLDEYDLIIRTSGLDKNLIKTRAKVWTVTNEFFDKCKAPIIGITGTKGKGTIASMIAAILQESGKKVWLTGNIGDVALKDLANIKPTDIVVDELSSFQLWDITKSPHVAVVNLIEPEHLNVHRDLLDYVTAKANIRRYQTDDDVCFYHPSNELSRQVATASNSGRIARFGIPDDGAVYQKEGSFWINEQIICSTNCLQLVGQHNIDNACAALSVAKYYNVDNRVIESALSKFKGLPHRIEFVREFNGIKYYNDSFSSSTPATVAAIKSFTSPEILIVGGVDRGGDFEQIAKEIAERQNIKTVIVIGEIRHKLAKIISDEMPSAHVEVSDAQTMSEVFALANSFAKSGDIVLLSPGCGSFDMFKDFYDRGDQFKNEVNKL